MRIFRHLISWALALFLVAMFIQSTIAPLPDPPEGSVKLFDAPGQNIVFQTIAERSGVSLFEPAGRFVIAIIELVAAFFLLLPWSPWNPFVTLLKVSRRCSRLVFKPSHLLVPGLQRFK